MVGKQPRKEGRQEEEEGGSEGGSSGGRFFRMDGGMGSRAAEGHGHRAGTAPRQGPAGRRALGIGAAAGAEGGAGAGGDARSRAGSAAGARPRHEGAAAGAAAVRAPPTPRRSKGTQSPLPRGGHQSPGKSRADRSPPAGRRMPCGRRLRALTPRCPARCPGTQGCVPAVTRISASSPGGTTAGGLWGHGGGPGTVRGWLSSHLLLSRQAVPGQGVPHVLRGHGQARPLLPDLLPAKAPAGSMSGDSSPGTVSGTPPALPASSWVHWVSTCPEPACRSCCPAFWV